MSRFDQLPHSWEEARPVMERITTELAAQTLILSGSRRRPEPPRNIQAQGGSLEILLTWNAPTQAKGIVGWKVYKDNEGNLIAEIRDFDVRQYKHKMPASTTAAFYVSSFTPKAESIKAQVLGTSNSDKLVVAGTTGETTGSEPSPPPEWEDEPFGGDQGDLPPIP